MPDDKATDPATPRESELLRQLEGLVAKNNGDPMAVIKLLFEDNYQVRLVNRKLREKNDELVKAAVPDGALVLTGDQAKQYQALQQLAIPLTEIPATLDAGQTALGKLGRYERLEVARKAAELVGYRPEAAEILVERAERDGLRLEIATVEQTVDGKKMTRDVARVRPVDDDKAQPTDLGDYADAHWTLYLPALKAEATPPGQAGRSAAGSAAPVSHSGATSRLPPSADVERIAEAQRLTGAYAPL
jgi:hypothetical protein